MSPQRRILVLGANSFSGQDFVDLLLDNPHNEVLGASRSAERPQAFLRYKSRPGPLNYAYHQLDMNRDMPRLLQLCDEWRPTQVVNFAAQSEVAPSWQNPEQWFQTNCVALAALVNHLRRQDYLQRYLHISSPEVYGTCRGTVTEEAPLNPSTPYAASKAAADLLLQTYHKQFGFPVVTVRATNVYGPRQQLHKIIPRSIIYLKLGRKIPLHGGGQAVKSYIHIRDVSRGELAILDDGEPGRIYHLSPSQGIAVGDAVRRICRRLGVEFDEAVSIVDERPGQDSAYLIDSKQAREAFGWRPRIDFNAGIDEVVDWVEQYWEEIQTLPLEYHHKA